MKRVLKNDVILAMSNVRGKYVKNPHQLSFSFYFSSGSGVPHSIRVKPSFNPDKKLKKSMTGTLKLCDDWEFIPGPHDGKVDSNDIADMKQFFRYHIVLFAAVWDEQLQDGILEDYFKGDITFNEMLQDLDFYDDYKLQLDRISTVDALESFCRKHELVNLYGN